MSLHRKPRKLKAWDSAEPLASLLRKFYTGNTSNFSSWDKARVNGHLRVKGDAEREARGIGTKPKPLTATLKKPEDFVTEELGFNVYSFIAKLEEGVW